MFDFHCGFKTISSRNNTRTVKDFRKEVLSNVAITGFDSFSGVPINTSKEVMKYMASESSIHQPFAIHTYIFPVVYQNAAKYLQDIIEQGRPDILILTGVSPKSFNLCLERIARNWDDSKTLDNRGEIRLNRPILPGGHFKYISELPLNQYQNRLGQMGIPVSLSDDAGGFVCNHYYYMANRLKESLNLPRVCLFVHLPDFAFLEKNQAFSIESLTVHLLALTRMIFETVCTSSSN